jgi:hypothetical protein
MASIDLSHPIQSSSILCVPRSWRCALASSCVSLLYSGEYRGLHRRVMPLPVAFLSPKNWFQA